MKNQGRGHLPFVFLAGDTREFFGSFVLDKGEVHDVPIMPPIGDGPGTFVVGESLQADRPCISYVKRDGTTHYFALHGEGLSLRLACVNDFPRGALRVLVSVEMAEHLRAGKGGFFVLWSNGADLVVDLESFGVAAFLDGMTPAKPFAASDETNTADMGFTGPRGGIVGETKDITFTPPRGGIVNETNTADITFHGPRGG